MMNKTYASCQDREKKMTRVLPGFLDLLSPSLVHLCLYISLKLSDLVLAIDTTPPSTLATARPLPLSPNLNPPPRNAPRSDP
jgi:hypothetical protein